MELIIYAPKEDGFIKEIEWNFEELKAEITQKTSDYTNLVYNEEQVSIAKKDKANFNKLIKALKDKLKEVKSQAMAPVEVFESQVKELIAIVEEQAIDNIDSQIKGIEEGQRQEKEKKCQEIYKECIGDLDRTVPFEKVFNPKWLNKTTTEKAIREEITALRDRVDQELKVIITESSTYAYEMKEEYLKNFDLSAAMAVKQRLEETEKKKAIYEEQERQRKAEEEKRLAEEARAVQSAGNGPAPVINLDENGDPIVTQDERTEKLIAFTFRVVAKESQLDALNIAYKQLKANSEDIKMIKREEL